MLGAHGSLTASTVDSTRRAALNGSSLAAAPVPRRWTPPGYILLDVLGVGGTAVVHRALHVDSNRIVALKVMQDHLAANANLVARFRREIHTMSQLHHPNIVGVLEVARNLSTSLRIGASAFSEQGLLCS